MAQDMSTDWKMTKVKDPVRPGQSKLIMQRTLRCSCGGCNNHVVMRTDVELEDRETPYEIVDELKDVEGQFVKTGRKIKVVPFTSPKKSPEDTLLKIPDGWQCVTVMPYGHWPSDFINAVNNGADPKTAAVLFRESNDKFGRWYCCWLCRMLGELRIEAERVGVKGMHLGVLECIIKVVFFFTKFKKQR